jgi:serralysin
MAQPSAYEQYLLELINADRAPVGAQPLASNTSLDQAAESHSQWMINTDIFSHSGAGGSDAGTRMTAAGYTFGGSSWTWGENIAGASTQAPDGYQDEVSLLHTNLMNSPGHRENLLNGDFKEVGLGFEIGEYQGWQGAFVTEDFARSGTGSFLTGVAYNDRNGNRFYDPGEGLSGITVDAVDSSGTHFTTTTMDAGGYNLSLAPGTYSVTFGSGSGATAAQSVTMGASNVKVDAVDPTFASHPTTPQGTQTFYDTQNAYLWNYITVGYDGQGQLDYTAVYNDDGSAVVTDYDQANASLWSYAVSSYDGQNNLIYTYVQYDDGSGLLI